MNAVAVVAVAVAVVAVETMRKLKFSTYYVMVISLKPDWIVEWKRERTFFGDVLLNVAIELPSESSFA